MRTLRCRGGCARRPSRRTSAFSLGLYANVEPLERVWPTFGARSGREFMLTSGLGSIDEQAITMRQHAAALSLFLLYPLWYELGRRLARSNLVA